MSKIFKIGIILLGVVSIVTAVLAVFAFIGKEREYAKRVLLEDRLASTMGEKNKLESAIASGTKIKEQLEANIKKLEKDIESLSSQIEEDKESRKITAQELITKGKEIESLQENLEKEKKEKLVISKRLEELQLDYEKEKREKLRFRNEKAKVEQELAELKEKYVNLDTIVVTPPADSGPQQTAEPVKEILKGRVLVLNRDYSFIVTDLGQDDGVRPGMVFEIREGSALLGKAEIDKVYDTMSSASIMPGTDINNIKKGNLIIESR